MVGATISDSIRGDNPQDPPSLHTSPRELLISEDTESGHSPESAGILVYPFRPFHAHSPAPCPAKKNRKPARNVFCRQSDRPRITFCLQQSPFLSSAL